MILKGPDYELRQIDDFSPLWDVYILKVIRPKGCQSREELTNIAYGCTLSSAIRKIINYRINKKHFDNEGILELQTYIKEFKSSADKLDKLCKVEISKLEEENL